MRFAMLHVQVFEVEWSSRTDDPCSQCAMISSLTLCIETYRGASTFHDFSSFSQQFWGQSESRCKYWAPSCRKPLEEPFQIARCILEEVMLLFFQRVYLKSSQLKSWTFRHLQSLCIKDSPCFLETMFKNFFHLAKINIFEIITRG